MSPVSRAIKQGGGSRRLAKELGVSRQAVEAWRDRGCPANKVLRVEALTGVSRHVLRPDLYPREKRA